MDKSNFSTILQQLTMLFDPFTLSEMSKDTGFCKRVRNIDPFEFIVSLITAMASGSVQSFADLWRRFNEWTGLNVSYRAIYNQLSKEAFPEFMRQVVCHLLGICSEKVLSYPEGHAFAGFSRIVIQDGSSFALKESLKEVFPGRFKTISPAAVELHATMDLLSDQPYQIVLAPDTNGERQYLPEVETLTGCLSLMDRGYFDLKWFFALHEAKGSFIARAKESLNPVIQSGFNEDGKALASVAGRQLKDLLAGNKLPKRKRSDLDATWRINKQEVTFRLILWWNKEEKRYSYLITNLPREQFSTEDVSQAYRLRWQVELMFKEWKSYANLHRFDTDNPHLAEGLIWTSVATAIYKRFIAHAAQKVHGVEISTRKVAMSCGYLFIKLACRLLSTKPSGIRSEFKELLRFLSQNATRAHPKRDRRTGRLASGLEPVGCS